MSELAVNDALEAARRKLSVSPQVESSLPALAAAALAAAAGLVLAAAMILGPGVEAPAVERSQG